MNIIFTKLPATDGIIKISLDGGQSFIDYSIANIPEDGISLSDDQDYEKIRIKGPANILKNLSIVSSVKVEGASGGSDVDLSEYVQKEYFQGELYDGGCGYGYRITSWPDSLKDKSPDWLYSLCLSNGTSLGNLCEFNGHYNSYEYYQYDFNGNKIIPPNPAGRLYAMQTQQGSASEYWLLPTQYYLK